MNVLLPIISLLVVLALGLLVVRVAMMFTGLSKDLAWFQAHSAFMGVRLRTRESEVVVEHPVRRRIVGGMMLLGNAGLIAAVSSLIPVFITSGQGFTGFWARMLWLGSGLTLLWAVSANKTVDRVLYVVTRWALRRWTELELWDYPALLQLSTGYSVTELKVEPGDWLAGKSLRELRLPDEGVQVLGIRRVEGEYIGAPTADTYVRRGDTLVAYGRSEHLAEISKRNADPAGEAAHRQRVKEQYGIVKKLEKTQRFGAGENEAKPGPAPPDSE